MEKKCSCCKEIFDYDFFHKDKNTKSGLRSACVFCIKKRKEKNKEANALKRKERYNLSKHKVKANYVKDKDNILQKNREYYQKNREAILKQKKEYNKKNPHVKREYYEKNKEKINKRAAITHTIRRKNNPLLRFANNTSTLIRHSFKHINVIGVKKTQRTEDILGCSIEFFIEYLKSKFLEGMTIENHGEWHIDHIKPIYLAKTEAEVIEFNHYTNLQPLWKFDNLSKGKKHLTLKD
jgi:hypothetical protein